MHAPVDDHSRLAYVKGALRRPLGGHGGVPFAGRGGSFASHGVKVERAMTDNAWAYLRLYRSNEADHPWRR